MRKNPADPDEFVPYNPDDHDYLYFVARPNGTHIFTRSLTEHNRARREAAQMRAAATPPP